MLMFRLKGCSKCGGDLFLDEGYWHCLQCAKYYYRAGAPSYASSQKGGRYSAGGAFRGTRGREHAGREMKPPRVSGRIEYTEGLPHAAGSMTRW